jgi:hypothetical protein
VTDTNDKKGEPLSLADGRSGNEDLAERAVSLVEEIYYFLDQKGNLVAPPGISPLWDSMNERARRSCFGVLLSLAKFFRDRNSFLVGGLSKEPLPLDYIEVFNTFVQGDVRKTAQ